MITLASFSTLHMDYPCTKVGPVEKGITVFDNPKRLKVNKEFLSSSKITRLDFNSTQFQLLNLSLDNLLDNENASFH